MDYLCERDAIFDRIERTIRRTMFPHLKIIFNFSLNSEYFINDATNQEQSTINITSYVTFRESLSCHGVREAVEKAIGDHLDHAKLTLLIERVWREVREFFPSDKTLPKHTICYFDVPIWITHWHYRVVAESDHSLMLPAADSSLGMLDKYELHCDRETEKICCICLEEVGGGGGALRMPCSHVFHGGCIKEWLRTSHYCPICRYEMPTE